MLGLLSLLQSLINHTASVLAFINILNLEDMFISNDFVKPLSYGLSIGMCFGGLLRMAL